MIDFIDYAFWRTERKKKMKENASEPQRNVEHH